MTGILERWSSRNGQTAGPPVLNIHWTNRKISPSGGLEKNQSRIIALSAFVNVTEHLSGIGELLIAASGTCMMMSWNAMQCPVNVIVSTDPSQRKMMELLRRHYIDPAH